MKFILLHETKNDDGIKVFFNDLWELYVKVRSLFFSLLFGQAFNGFKKDGDESVPHRAHADTQRGVRQPGEGECEEAPVDTNARTVARHF